MSSFDCSSRLLTTFRDDGRKLAYVCKKQSLCLFDCEGLRICYSLRFWGTAENIFFGFCLSDSKVTSRLLIRVVLSCGPGTFLKTPVVAFPKIEGAFYLDLVFLSVEVKSTLLFLSRLDSD